MDWHEDEGEPGSHEDLLDQDEDEDRSDWEAPVGAEPEAGMEAVTDAELEDLIERGQPIVRASGRWDAATLSQMFADADLADPGQREVLRDQVHADLGL
ncbi:hypothetical protein ABZ234_31955 [Nocardiopsis sp. NPDC006198]|uniref:hypothetical protein n=1 Tax=Nocardiopsis sp. NPDC006198 TaxID=3154472 RepID=UPI0033ACAD69